MRTLHAAVLVVTAVALVAVIIIVVIFHSGRRGWRTHCGPTARVCGAYCWGGGARAQIARGGGRHVIHRTPQPTDPTPTERCRTARVLQASLAGVRCGDRAVVVNTVLVAWRWGPLALSKVLVAEGAGEGVDLPRHEITVIHIHRRGRREATGAMAAVRTRRRWRWNVHVTVIQDGAAEVMKVYLLLFQLAQALSTEVTSVDAGW